MHQTYNDLKSLKRDQTGFGSLLYIDYKENNQIFLKKTKQTNNLTNLRFLAKNLPSEINTC
ncbi:hypothetical protein STRPS_1815 [Streptococcus pseudoporcinus LQ 940-04]|uniref:Uncharacterized protein n=1 Tax=Streptococcus pseudoporcinus LQ 940-04 TaxID=875093 RepID=G5KBU2_9STRE|nr:hypothetical protein HMPREF9320_1546 [Streptococcus pseudoporcinus SPIN 20026]EHI65007.1 hypothetical protein STRPS_1815 [Streptococcus pseudoporcinus LQ 940-04]